jgi:Na+/proline symporter
VTDAFLTDLAHILLTAALGCACALLLWMWLARRLVELGKTRWRAVPLCLPLLLISLAYGTFWLVFFSSPQLAVQAHAVRLTLASLTGPIVPWVGAAWLALSAALLWPLKSGSCAPAAPQTR